MATHVTDLAVLYALLVENILQHNPIPSDDKGIYFGLAHRMSWWKIRERMAENLYNRGLVNEPNVQTWPSYEQAADELGFPRAYIRAMSTARFVFYSETTTGLLILGPIAAIRFLSTHIRWVGSLSGLKKTWSNALMRTFKLVWI